MAWWLLPAATWLVGAVLVVRVSVRALADARLALRALDGLQEQPLVELAVRAELLRTVLAAARVEASHPLRLVRAAATTGRRLGPASEP
jgi:hypothetical protein